MSKRSTKKFIDPYKSGKWLEATMPNGKRLGSCTCEDILNIGWKLNVVTVGYLYAIRNADDPMKTEEFGNLLRSIFKKLKDQDFWNRQRQKHLRKAA